jgi:glycosyltransferase involved in cell wall biosynthesis
VTVAVLQLIAGLDPRDGGPPTAAVATALALRHQGFANEFAFSVERGREDTIAVFMAKLNASGISVHRFRQPPVFGSYGRRWGINPRLGLWALRNGSRFDVIHVHSSWTFTTIVGLLSAKMYRRVAVLSTHESLTEFDRNKSGPLLGTIKQFLRWVYVRSFDVVVVASTLEQSDLSDGAGLRSVVVPHAVIGASVVRRRPSNGDELRVGFLGRLHPKKNLELLIDALALLPERVSLHVAGDGPPAYRESLEYRAMSSGVAERIRWLGFIDGAEKDQFLASIDVLAMPSSFEGFGVAAVEALSAGVPVIVSPRVGIADVVVEYRCGSVVASAAQEIACAVVELMKDSGRHHQLSENARLAAAREFSVETHGERIKAEYEGALGTRRERSRT